jgi:hypothetical protein
MAATNNVAVAVPAAQGNRQLRTNLPGRTGYEYSFHGVPVN